LALRHWTSLVCVPPWQEWEHWGNMDVMTIMSDLCGAQMTTSLSERWDITQGHYETQMERAHLSSKSTGSGARWNLCWTCPGAQKGLEGYSEKSPPSLQAQAEQGRGQGRGAGHSPDSRAWKTTGPGRPGPDMVAGQGAWAGGNSC
jgi:hypothetical protein